MTSHVILTGYDLLGWLTTMWLAIAADIFLSAPSSPVRRRNSWPAGRNTRLASPLAIDSSGNTSEALTVQ